MKKLKRWMYSKTLRQMLTVLLMVSIFTPLTAYTMATEPPLPTVEPMATERVAAESGDMLLLDPEAEGENLLPLEPTAKNSEPTADGEATPDDTSIPDENTANPTLEIIPLDGTETPVPDEALGDISLLSGWIDTETTFYTRIRLVVRDTGGKAIQGVIYGLYRADNHMLLEELKTNEDGIAQTGDLPADTDYYLEEIAVPAGWQPNTICVMSSCDG